MHELVRLSDVSVGYASNSQVCTLLTSVDLSIYEDQWTLLYGPSGSGKTTLLNLLAGQAGCHLSGRVEILYKKNEMAYMPQQACLLEGVSILDNIQMLSLLKNKPSKLKVEELGHAFQFTQPLKQSIQGLSGGERMKVALMRALLMEPRILFLDEPSCHWDHQTTHDIMHALQSLQRLHKFAIVMVTHDQELRSYAQSSFDVRMYQPARA